MLKSCHTCTSVVYLYLRVGFSALYPDAPAPLEITPILTAIKNETPPAREEVFYCVGL